jgi:hypothetical protein
MTDITLAIKAIDPDANVCVVGDDLNQITWLHGTTPISDEAILAKQIELQAEYDAKEYARNRESEYPTIAELVVALYDTDDKSSVELRRAAVKLKYPKPS